MQSARLIELWRGDLRESVHRGHAVICDRRGIVEAWGRSRHEIFPRSSCKMIQALPLVESGAADAAGLTDRQLALACASHSGARMHVEAVGRWLAGMGLSEADLRCGCHMPRDRDEHRRLLIAGTSPGQLHNNCSGKHAGFLTLARHLGADPDYVAPDHPVQQAFHATLEEISDDVSPGFGIDGCSAPNWSISIEGLARAMAAFADPPAGVRGAAMQRLAGAMQTFPEMIAGEGRFCTVVTRALRGQGVVKAGAEGVMVAILPDQGLGIAVKIDDGASRASEAAILALLVHLGALDPADSVVLQYLGGPIRNWRGLVTGQIRTAPGFPGPASRP